jgi:UDP-sugar transporter A1/2/3
VPSRVCWLVAHSWKMMVPAVIYLVMNILGFVALGHLDAATFSIVAQMKVLTTALFSVLILR